MNPTMNTTEEFDQWWREAGQFIQPADMATQEQLEQFRLFGSSVFQEFSSQIQELKDNAANAEEEASEHSADTPNRLKEILEDDLSDSEKLQAIEKYLA